MLNDYRKIVEGHGGLLEDENTVYDICLRLGKWLVAGKKDSLLLIGNVGTGKTTIMKAIDTLLRVRCNAGCIFLQAMQLPEAALEHEEFFQRQCLEGRYPATFLMIDDIGREPAMVQDYGNIIKPFERIIESRYDKQKPVILSTNFTLDEIGRDYGERVQDRLTEMADILTFTNNSFRK